MNSEEKLNKLTDWARSAHRVDSSPAPFGFATRVAARWAAAARLPDVWEWLSVRSLAVALTIMLATLIANHDLLTDGFTIEVTVADSVTGPLL